MDPPQLSPMLPPQYCPPTGLHVARAHDVPPTHKWFAQDHPSGHAAVQVSVPPQPSPRLPPQYCPPGELQVCAVQVPDGMHWLLTQLWPLSQVPQSTERPQPSPTLPQYLPRPVPQLMGVQPAPPTQTLLAHDQPAGQAALQSMDPPQPSPSVPPQYCPPGGVQLSGVQVPLGTH